MKNIYDLRKEGNMICFFSSKEANHNKEVNKNSVAVVINLYYEDSVEKYLKYIKSSTKCADVYIFSANENVLRDLNNKNMNCIILRKKNRGRDVSALLVSFKPYFEKYKYICFLHDKMHKFEVTKKDTDNWNWNIWSNLIDSDNYIQNVLDFFECNENVGLLIPPEPLGDYLVAWYTNAWCGNFDNCVNLAKTLNLNCNIDKNKSPLALSTAFWARTSAVKKIFEKEWKYEDFPDEPLADDGTISHAIERVWGFLVQDAGYDLVTLINEDYAKWEMLYVQDSMKKMFSLLESELGVHDIYEISTYEERVNIIKEFANKNEKIFLYGAGKYGKDLLKLMKRKKMRIDGFCVTKLDNENKNIDDLKVYSLEEVVKQNNVGIIIAVKYNLHEEFVNNLNKFGFENYIIAY